MKPKLILHVGHGKTGTSFIQSVLSLNVEKLKNNGILYPDHPSLSAASKGYVSSGNGALIYDSRFKLATDSVTLLSNEKLFHTLLQNNNLEKFVLERACSLEVICYTRNVYEFISSVWGQRIKRDNYTKSISEYIIEEEDDHHQKVLWWLNAAEEHGFRCTVRNYSNHKSSLAAVFLEDVLGSDGLNFEIITPDNRIINRSLTLTEYEIQRVCNERIAGSSVFISDVLVNTLPRIKAEKPRITQEAYNIIAKRVAPIIECINERIDRHEAVVLEDPGSIVANEGESFQYSLSGDQIAVLFSSIIEQLSLGLRDADAEYLRDIAIKIEGQSGPLPHDALQLMKLALRARPGGPFIKKKIEEWEDKLKFVQER